MTAQEFVGAGIERAGEALALFIETTPTEKQQWTPNVEGAAGLHPVLEQVAECVMVNTYFGLLLRGLPTPGDGWRGVPPVVFTDGVEAQEAVRKSAGEIADIVRGMPDDGFAREFQTSRGPLSGERALEVPFRHMWYHIGQINLLQLLYGDTHFHGFPAPPPQP